jgi:hypothetical protein
MKAVMMYFAGSLLLLSLGAIPTDAQKKYSSENGEINFTSNAQLEMIQASSNQLRGIIDTGTNQFAFRVSVQSFKGFNSGLQRDHFNENYLESERWPSASFAGKIIEQVDFTTDGTYDVRAKGELEIHGQKQTRIIKSKLTIRNGIIEIGTSFVVPLADHNISIPRIVSQKIATEIEVQIKVRMTVKP